MQSNSFCSSLKILSISVQFHCRIRLKRLYTFGWVLQHKHHTSVITHLAGTSCNLLILSFLICIQRCLSCIAALMKLVCSVEALGGVSLRHSNMLILNAFCQRTPWWVSVARHCDRGRTDKSLLALFSLNLCLFLSLSFSHRHADSSLSYPSFS